MATIEENLQACRQNVYRLQLGGDRLCKALRAIADGAENPKEVALKALSHREPDPNWSKVDL